jgi:hypothetical protein
MFRQSILLVWLAATATTTATVNVQQGEAGGLSVELMSAFKGWTEAHGKLYENHDEKMERLQVWIDNDGTYTYKHSPNQQGLPLYRSRLD